MDAVVDRYFPIIDAIETELEEIEDADLRAGRGAREHRAPVRPRSAAPWSSSHAVAPLLEAAGKLIGGRVPAVCEGSREYFRDVYDHLARINGTLDTLRDTIGTAIQVNLSMVTIEESEATKRLAAWAGDLRGGHRVRRHLGHELRGHARAASGHTAIRWRWR